MTKPKRANKGYQLRPFKNRQPLQRFLIVCEGEKTEKFYFDGFRSPNLVIVVEGMGKDPLTVVDKANSKRKEANYDQVWCVFDRDEVTADNFSQALAKAKRLDIKVAYSNPAFELWFLLHFHYYHTSISQTDCETRLGQCLSKLYDKTDPMMYQRLLNKQPVALNHARRLLTAHEGTPPADANPSTTVHLLVDAINQYGRLHHA